MPTAKPLGAITVMCTAESHADRVVTVAVLYPWNPRGSDFISDEDGWFFESDRTIRRPTIERRADGSGTFVDRKSNLQKESLIADQVHDAEKHGRDAEGDFVLNGRERWSFRCNLCGLSVAARAEKLAPKLHRLRHAGVSTLELAHVGAIVN